ncbi:MAG: ArsR/SmtB family transcription factor [Thermoplasmata archaeon]
MANDGCSFKNVEKVNVKDFQKLEEIISVISNKTRLAILFILLKYDEICACELESVLNMRQPTITSHLIKLYNAGILIKREKWKFTYYSLQKNFKPLILSLINFKK